MSNPLIQQLLADGRTALDRAGVAANRIATEALEAGRSAIAARARYDEMRAAREVLLQRQAAGRISDNEIYVLARQTENIGADTATLRNAADRCAAATAAADAEIAALSNAQVALRSIQGPTTVVRGNPVEPTIQRLADMENQLRAARATTASLNADVSVIAEQARQLRPIEEAVADGLLRTTMDITPRTVAFAAAAEPQRILVIGAERAEEFEWALARMRAGADVTVVNPIRSAEATQFEQHGGRFLQIELRELPAGQTFHVIREDLPYPTVDGPGFVSERVERLAPGGTWSVATDSGAFADEMLVPVARGQGMHVAAAEVRAPWHEATPRSPTYGATAEQVVVIHRPLAGGATSPGGGGAGTGTGSLNAVASDAALERATLRALSTEVVEVGAGAVRAAATGGRLALRVIGETVLIEAVFRGVAHLRELADRPSIEAATHAGLTQSVAAYLATPQAIAIADPDAPAQWGTVIATLQRESFIVNDRFRAYGAYYLSGATSVEISRDWHPPSSEEQIDGRLQLRLVIPLNAAARAADDERGQHDEIGPSDPNIVAGVDTDATALPPDTQRAALRTDPDAGVQDQPVARDQLGGLPQTTVAQTPPHQIPPSAADSSAVTAAVDRSLGSEPEIPDWAARGWGGQPVHDDLFTPTNKGDRGGNDVTVAGTEVDAVEEPPSPWGAIGVTEEPPSPWGAIGVTEEPPSPWGAIGVTEEPPSPWGAIGGGDKVHRADERPESDGGVGVAEEPSSPWGGVGGEDKVHRADERPDRDAGDKVPDDYPHGDPSGAASAE